MYTGKVQWFDKPSGEGMVVRDSDNACLYVHWSCITEGERGQKNLNAGDLVEFTTYKNLYSERVETISVC